MIYGDMSCSQIFFIFIIVKTEFKGLYDEKKQKLCKSRNWNPENTKTNIHIFWICRLHCNVFINFMIFQNKKRFSCLKGKVSFQSHQMCILRVGFGMAWNQDGLSCNILFEDVGSPEATSVDLGLFVKPTIQICTDQVQPIL